MEREPKIVVKRNAFEFMMESRKKSIGRNSPGKTLDENNRPKASEEAKEKLTSRKSLFQKWADEKGGAKRKAEEEVKDKIIKTKLEKRAKRLKKLLTQKEDTSSDDSNDQFAVKQKKITRRLSSDSENSCEIIEPKLPVSSEQQKSLVNFFQILNKKNTKSLSGNEQKHFTIINSNTKHLETIDENILTPKSLKKWKMRIKLLLPEVDDDNSNQNCTNGAEKANIKLAPIFLPKPRALNFEATEKFLQSGIPDSMKRKLEKHQSYQDIKYDVFPSISHVQQKTQSKGDEIDFWNLPPSELFLKLNESATKVTFDGKLNFLYHENSVERTKLDGCRKVNSLKNALQHIKSENPNFLVNKTFKTLYERTKPKQSQIGKRKKRIADFDTADKMMWPIKYRPESSDEIFYNKKASGEFKKWLELWINYKKSRSDSSGAEFDFNDSSSDPIKSTIILHGPCGSGKTSTVYAVCKELGIQILEVNASSKRTGKYLLQKVQESTQSHQIKSTEISYENEQICLLLIEDVDVIFDQDDGFINSLLQVSMTTKRPIVLTTTDKKSSFVNRFVQYPIIEFDSQKTKNVVTWLQIVCLNEEFYVDKQSLCDLLNYKKQDVRATLLSLQFWCQSGGQLWLYSDEVTLPLIKDIKKDSNDKDMLWLKDSKKGDNFHVHHNCVRDFVTFSQTLPFPIDLNVLWWNLPNVFCLPVFDHKKKTPVEQIKPKTVDDKERKQLENLREFYDYILLVDVAHRKLNKTDGELSSKPVIKYDSLNLNDSYETYNENFEMINTWTHELLERCINCTNKNVSVNCGVPDEHEKRWKKNQTTSFEALTEAVSFNYRASQSVIATDYVPFLRTMSRSEVNRYKNNNKRGRRFLNYLRGLGVRTTDKILQTACDSLFDMNDNIDIISVNKE